MIEVFFSRRLRREAVWLNGWMKEQMSDLARDQKVRRLVRQDGGHWAVGIKGKKEAEKNEVDLEHNSPHAVVESLVMMTSLIMYSRMRGREVVIEGVEVDLEDFSTRLDGWLVWLVGWFLG